MILSKRRQEAYQSKFHPVIGMSDQIRSAYVEGVRTLMSAIVLSVTSMMNSAWVSIMCCKMPSSTLRVVSPGGE
jgi:hypothetical protein